MYFGSRTDAGIKLASKLYDAYRHEDSVVVALNEGGILVGEQIARYLHCVMLLFLTSSVKLPGESGNFGVVDEKGEFTYSDFFTKGEASELEQEFHGYIDDEKRDALSRLNRLVGEGGVMDNRLIRNRVVFLVSDGFESASQIEAAMQYLKPLRVQKVMAVAPFVTSSSIDKIRLLTDGIEVLDIKSNIVDVNHYYENNMLPSRDEAIKKINDIILNWR